MGHLPDRVTLELVSSDAALFRLGSEIIGDASITLYVPGVSCFVHFNILPRYRGRIGIEAARAGLDYVFQFYDVRVACVMSPDRYVMRFASWVGFTMVCKVGRYYISQLRKENHGKPRQSSSHH